MIPADEKRHAMTRSLLRPETRRTVDGVALHLVAAGPPGSLAARLNEESAPIPRAGEDGAPERRVAEAGPALRDDGRLAFVEGTGHRPHLAQPDGVDGRIIDVLGGR